VMQQTLMSAQKPIAAAPWQLATYVALGAAAVALVIAVVALIVAAS
jgi:hypothetical protein